MSAQQQETLDPVKPGRASNARPIRTLAELDLLPDSALITDPENCLVLNVGRTTAWRGIKDGFFPPPVRFGPRMKRYVIGKARACAKGEEWRDE